MVLSPILGIALALLLAAAINSVMLPIGDEANLQGVGSVYEPTPIPMPTHPTQPAAASVTGGPISPFLFIAGAVIVGFLAIMLFFREKSLTKALSE
jgi:hypothetical protein